MKKFYLFFFLCLSTLSVSAQMSKGEGRAFGGNVSHGRSHVKSSLTLNIKSIESADSIRIQDFIENKKKERGRSVMAVIGASALNSLIAGASNVIITQLMELSKLRKKMKEKWNKMIKNECLFVDSLSSINGLKDFYSSGSFDGPLDPSNFNFNGFSLEASNYEKTVLRAYCHVATDSAGLSHIFNHSKFVLILDSLFFNPYYCHLPNLSANAIELKDDKKYKRRTTFSYEERNNLVVSLNFSISSSWYNEAIMLAKDVELGSFSIQVPIDKEKLVDSVFVYRRDVIKANRERTQANVHKDIMPDTTYLNLSGECYIVPRSYMPLSGGIAHWGTGEYNVKVSVSEQCTISNEIKKHWYRDYRQINQMKKGSEFWDYLKNIYVQDGRTIVKSVLQSASTTAIQQAKIGNASSGTGSSGTGKTPVGNR